MNWKYNIVLIGITVLLCSNTQAQVFEFDQLEMYYDQAHYKMVKNKANRLLDDPAYDYSELPTFYKSLSLFQLCRKKGWFKRHPEALNEAKNLFLEVKQSNNGLRILRSHIYEVSFLKRDLISWSSDLKIQGKDKEFDHIQQILAEVFKDVPTIDTMDPESAPDSEELEENLPEIETLTISEVRKTILATANEQLGVPYKWAGTTSKGFDCSGFTGYVMQSAGKELPRRAVDQHDAAKKVKEKNVKPGDLVFFDGGTGISHVGIICSTENGTLQMIHASSSKGISIVDIRTSKYWNSRLHSFGTYL